MFVAYALSFGLALALLGLYHELAGHLGWSRSRKGWGGFAIVLGTMGVVPAIVSEVSQLAVAAACSCIVLALSVRGYQEVSVQQPAGDSTCDAEVYSTELIPFIDDTVNPVQESVVSTEIQEPAPAEAEAVELEAEAVELEAEAVELEAETVELEAEAVELEAEAVEPGAAEVRSPEWLNGQIAEAYKALAVEDFVRAMTAFREAAAHCADGELLGMLQEEIRNLEPLLPDHILQAS